MTGTLERNPANYFTKLCYPNKLKAVDVSAI